MSNVKQCSDAATSSHKPCPFCGGHPEIFNYERGYASFVYVLCTKCGARTKAVRFPTYNNCPGDLTLTCAERDAFKLWDDRHCPVPELTEGELKLLRQLKRGVNNGFSGDSLVATKDECIILIAAFDRLTGRKP